MVNPEAEEASFVVPAMFGLGGMLEDDAAVDGLFPETGYAVFVCVRCGFWG